MSSPPKRNSESSGPSDSSPSKANKAPGKSVTSRKTKGRGGGEGVDLVASVMDPKTIAENQDEEIVFGEESMANMDHKDAEDPAAKEEVRLLVREPTITNRRSAELQSAVFAFDNIRHIVGRGEDDKLHILRNISGKIKCGRKFQ
jgi:hypothetical protein